MFFIPLLQLKLWRCTVCHYSWCTTSSGNKYSCCIISVWDFVYLCLRSTQVFLLAFFFTPSGGVKCGTVSVCLSVCLTLESQCAWTWSVSSGF